MTNFKKKTKRSLGECQFCNSPIYEYSFGWACSNKECKTVIYRDDKFFNIVLHRPISKSKAVTLLTGGKVHLKGVDIHGKKHDMDIGLSFDRSGTYNNRYTMNYLDYEYCKKSDPNFDDSLDSNSSDQVTGFDILNGD